MDNQIVVSDYAQMDRVLREERSYILNLVKQVKKAGCNVLLIQKSILRYGRWPQRNVPSEFPVRFIQTGLLLWNSCDRDALSDLALHFLNKMKIMVVKDIEREEIEFICKASVVAVALLASFHAFLPNLVYIFVFLILQILKRCFLELLNSPPTHPPPFFFCILFLILRILWPLNIFFLYFVQIIHF